MWWCCKAGASRERGALTGRDGDGGEGGGGERLSWMGTWTDWQEAAVAVPHPPNPLRAQRVCAQACFNHHNYHPAPDLSAIHACAPPDVRQGQQ
eukprot:365834-Chlamydomonas_euryale.AAC.5